MKRYYFFTLESKESEFLYSGFDHLKNGKMIVIKRGNSINKFTRNIVRLYTQNGKMGIAAKALTKKIVREQVVADISKNSDDHIVFIVYARVYESLGRILTDELRASFPDAEYCVYFADLQKRFAINLDSYRRDFDYLFSFDRKQAEEYGLHYLLEPFTYKPMNEDIITPTYDVTYVGRVKNDIKRHNEIIRVFEQCRRAGLKCDFHIVDASPELQKYPDEIEYNSFMSFEEIIQHVIQSNAVLEVLQTDEISPTTRYTEACLYNRNLITNCSGIRDNLYKKDENILLLDENTEIDASWIRKRHVIDTDYYKKLFSIESFIRTVDAVIQNNG